MGEDSAFENFNLNIKEAESMKKIFIGGAWPYANGSLHLGHAAALLPGDVLARYFRQKGYEVLYVSGSDCHGTPIAIRAKSEGVSPNDVADKYHKEFKDCFEKLGFSYDIYSKTHDENHAKVVQEIIKKLYSNGKIYSKKINQVYCENCKQFLPDRFVEGICPHCGSEARGDQCDNCSELLEPTELLHKKCKICGSTPVIKETEHLFFKLSAFQEELESYVNCSSYWRENAIALTNRYLKEGLKDRAVTRDLNWGISVPIEGFEDKKVYVWIDAVIGYLSASIKWAEENHKDYREFWSEDVCSYYVHGKDNIPFHSLILPAILKGIGGLHLPDRIISSEYLTIEGKKLSTSKNWAVWLPYVLEKYNPDSIRYFLIAGGPERRDADFSWREFVNSHNGELLGAFGNLVNRTFAFIEKSYDGNISKGNNNKELEDKIINTYRVASEKIEAAQFKDAIEAAFLLVRYGNKYFDEKKPWTVIKEDKEAAGAILYDCVLIIANLSNILNPFLPYSCEKIRQMLKLEGTNWEYMRLQQVKLDKVFTLFERIDKKVIDHELQKLLENNIINS